MVPLFHHWRLPEETSREAEGLLPLLSWAGIRDSPSVRGSQVQPMSSSEGAVS